MSVCDFEWALGVGITAKPGQPWPVNPFRVSEGSKTVNGDNNGREETHTQ